MSPQWYKGSCTRLNMYFGGEFCLGVPPGSLLPAPCPSSLLGARYPPGKIGSFSPAGALRVPPRDRPEPGRSHPHQRGSAPAPSPQSIPTISPRSSQALPTSSAPSPLSLFLFSRWSRCCSPEDGEGEAGEVPNRSRLEMGFTTGWISWMRSPKRAGAAACTACTTAALVHHPHHHPTTITTSSVYWLLP